MRMKSCNGCRALRKGCSRHCSIRPSLLWIQSPDSQATATRFLAKFYGRAGLINLICSGPAHLRPEIFKSLLYEACGRIINPIHGAVGLLRSGDWPRCEAAVEAVLRGAPLVKETSDDAGSGSSSVAAAGSQACDIRHRHRHVSNADSLRPVRTRNRLKRPVSKGDKRAGSASAGFLIEPEAPKFTITGWEANGGGSGRAFKRSPSPNEIELELQLGLK